MGNNKIKCMTIVQEKVNLFLFTDRMIIYIENQSIRPNTWTLQDFRTQSQILKIIYISFYWKLVIENIL